MSNTIYKTNVFNLNGTDGYVESDDGLHLEVASVSDSAREGTNPEQLIGMSWATCLNSTMRALLKARKIEANSKVRVEVSFKQEKAMSYYFELHAYASIEGMSAEESLKIAEQAHRRCPVSKLMEGSETVFVHAEAYE